MAVQHPQTDTQQMPKSHPRAVVSTGKASRGRRPLRMRMAPQKEFRALIRIASALQALCLLAVFGLTDVLAQTSPSVPQVSLSVTIQGDGTISSSPPLSCNDGICGGEFPRGTVVRLRATPGEGQILSQWRGACNGKRVQCRVRLRRDKQVFATFEPPPLISIRVDLRGEGTVTSSHKLDCIDSVCTGAFPRGTIVQLTAKPDEGRILSRWRGACGGKREQCRVRLRRNPQRVLAVFRTPPLIPLRVVLQGEGTVTSSSPGLECINDVCRGRFPQGFPVTLHAEPTENSSFNRWRGACRGSDKDECIVNMRRPRNIIARFTANPPAEMMTLAMGVTGSGSILVSPGDHVCSGPECQMEFPVNTALTLTPKLDEGQPFSWGGACEGQRIEACSLILTTSLKVTAAFEPPPPPPPITLTLNLVGNGSVVSDPPGIDCQTGSGICQGEFDQGTMVSLTSLPGEGYAFGGWTGACMGMDICIIHLLAPAGQVSTANVVAPYEVTATFVQLPVDLSVMVVGDGTVVSSPEGINCQPNCTASFNSESMVTLSATPTPGSGYTFSGWSHASCPGTETSCTVTLTSATAMPITATFAAPPSGGLTDAEAIRFLEQSTWGPNPASIAHLKDVGIEAFLTEQFQVPPSDYPVPDPDSNSLSLLRDQWFFNAFHGEDQLRQRVAFALSQLFVVSANTVGSDEQMIPYQQMLHENAFGNFRDLMELVTLSPTMGRFLDMVNNDRTDPGSGLNPNENYAREILQLFTVGTTLLNVDGSIIQDANGQPIQPYDNDVIVNLSKVFTGWTYPTQPGATLKWTNPSYYDGPMEAVEDHHDKTRKFLMTINGVQGEIEPDQSAQQDLADALDHIFTHPNVGPFIATRLIRNLVTSNPSPQYIQDVATVFNNDGTGERGNMQAVIQAILTHPEAATVTPNGGHLREPILFVIALLRSVNADVQLDNVLSDRTEGMGQSLFSPPSVFNYFSPLYLIPGTMLFGPEYQIFNESTGIARLNFVDRVVTNQVGTGVTVDLSPFVSVAGDVDQLIDAVAHTLLHEPLTTEEREILRTALAGTTNSTTRARSAFYLIATSGKYQVQH